MKGARVNLRIGVEQQISMCGKKSNPREGGQQEPRKQFLDSSLFYHEYLNNSLNYILSGSNDLDHSIQLDVPALKQIISTDATEQSVHFIERVKLMKTRCDPNTYLKDVQEYGQFINYEAYRTNNQEIAGIEAELEEEFEISIKLKRIKKRFRRAEDKLTLCQIDTLDKQMRANILGSFFEHGREEIDRHLDQNKLYREMFNIQQSVKKEERVEIKKEKSRKGPRRTKTNDDYMPASVKYKETIAFGEKIVNNGSLFDRAISEDKVKKEENAERNPIRMFPTSLPPLNPPSVPQIQPASALEVPAKVASNNCILPLVSISPLASQIPPPPPSQPVLQAEVKTDEKMQQEMRQHQAIERPAMRQEVNPASSLNSSAEPNFKSESEGKRRKQKKIEKEEKEGKERRPRGPKQRADKQNPSRQKRPYRKRQTALKPEDVRFPAPIPQYVPLPPQQVQRSKPKSNAGSISIGIQADGNEDLQNLKVIAPRATFLFEPIRPAVPPAQTPPERRQSFPERRLSESLNLNRSGNLSSSRQMGEIERRQSISSNRMDLQIREVPEPRTPAQVALDSHRQSQNSDMQERKPEDFDISDYLI